MKIYITHLLKILNFSSPFRRFEIKPFLCRPTMVAANISNLVAPLEFFSFLRACIKKFSSISTKVSAKRNILDKKINETDIISFSVLVNNLTYFYFTVTKIKASENITTKIFNYF